MALQDKKQTAPLQTFIRKRPLIVIKIFKIYYYKKKINIINFILIIL